MSFDEENIFDLNDSSKVSPPGGGLEGAGIEVDLNCDMGEGIGNDESIMPYISSANIACGYHAGDEKTIWQTIQLALKYNVSVGAHPSFHDKINFGRKEIEMTEGEIYELVIQQLFLFNEIAHAAGTIMQHVKPHGALYNLSARSSSVAKLIAKAIQNFDPKLVLFGLSGSHSITEAQALGLKTASEAFADRSYRDDGSLTPRTETNALIEDEEKTIQQVLEMIKNGKVTTVSGMSIPILAETICIHGDGKQAAAFAKKISEVLKNQDISLKSIRRE